ncbi:MAG: hypothetical protein ACRD6W_15200, partial [Nitrososphaerales archaeon]
LEERFFYGWRSLEVIANDDLRYARAALDAGDSAPARTYLDPPLKAWLARERITLEAESIVKVSVQRRLPDADLVRIVKYYELRNAIAHGDVDREAHREIVREANGIVGMARACLVRDLSATILIPEFRPPTE